MEVHGRSGLRNCSFERAKRPCCLGTSRLHEAHVLACCFFGCYWQMSRLDQLSTAGYLSSSANSVGNKCFEPLPVLVFFTLNTATGRSWVWRQAWSNFGVKIETASFHPPFVGEAAAPHHCSPRNTPLRVRILHGQLVQFYFLS